MSVLTNLLLEKPQIIGIAVGAVVAVLLIIIIIAVLRKKSKANHTPALMTVNDRELVAENAKRVEALIVLAGDDEELVNSLNALQEQLKYLVPTDDKKVYDSDMKIKHNIEDMKIVLTKDGKDKADKANSLIKDIKVLIADRNVNVL